MIKQNDHLNFMETMQNWDDVKSYGGDERFLSEQIHSKMGPAVVYYDSKRLSIADVRRDRYDESYVAMETLAEFTTSGSQSAVNGIQRAIPLVLMALDYQVAEHVPTHTLAFHCQRNERVVILSNVEQKGLPDSCAVVERVQRSVPELPWSWGAGQRVFFERWYVLRDWMRSSHVDWAFTMDSDAIVGVNITNLVQTNWDVIEKHAFWLVWEPPRTTMAFALFSQRALDDVTSYWNQLLKPSVWTLGTPNDMIAMGHYVHSAHGKPYPCWGYGFNHKAGSCDDTIDYGRSIVLKRMSGVKAQYVPGTFGPSPNTSEQLHARNLLNQRDRSVLVVDKNAGHDPLGLYNRRKGHKELRFTNGVPELKRRDGTWTPIWGHILEDGMERCAYRHVQLMETHQTCHCTDWCCTV